MPRRVLNEFNINYTLTNIHCTSETTIACNHTLPLFSMVPTQICKTDFFFGTFGLMLLSMKTSREKLSCVVQNRAARFSAADNALVKLQYINNIKYGKYPLNN